MGGTLNIQEVINRSTSQVPLSDLTRKGVKQVKVLNQAAIVRLITEAVDRVITKRAEEISAAERRKVIEESRKEFESLARKRVEQEQSRARELENVNRSLSDQVEKLRSQMNVSDELQAEFNTTAEKLHEIENESNQLREQLRAKEHALSEACSALATKEEELAAKDQELSAARQENLQLKEQPAARAQDRDEEVRSLQQELLEREKVAARLEGEMQAKDEEIQRLMKVSDALAEKVMSQVGTAQQQTGDSDLIRESLEKMRQALSNLASRGGVGSAGAAADDVDAETLLKFADRGDDLSVDSNIQKVKVEQKKAGGVKGSLAKLKSLQKGV